MTSLQMSAYQRLKENKKPKNNGGVFVLISIIVGFVLFIAFMMHYYQGFFGGMVDQKFDDSGRWPVLYPSGQGVQTSAWLNGSIVWSHNIDSNVPHLDSAIIQDGREAERQLIIYKLLK